MSFENNNVKVFNNGPMKKSVNVRNIEPINGIQIVRDRERSVSSDSGSSVTSSGDSESQLSEIMKYNSKKHSSRKGGNKHSSNKGNFRTSKGVKSNSTVNKGFDRDVDYSAFSNPKKISKNEDSESDYSEYSESGSEPSESGESGSDYSNNSESREKAKWEEKQKLKHDLLMKIQALEKKGYEFPKKYNMSSNFDEMQLEYDKIKHNIETQGAIRFSRRCLMACVTGLEFVNKKFDPFSVKLEGWSENVMENIDDYDNIFERLHEKYSSKAEISPEIELILTLGGSAFMFHLTNSLLKSPSFTIPGIPSTPGGPGGAIPGINPNFMQNMMASMSQGMKEMGKMNQSGGPPPPPVETRGIRKEMKGPNIDSNLFAGTPLMSNYPKPPAPVEYVNEYPINEDDRFSVASSDSSLSSSVVSVKKISTKRGGNVKKNNNGFELNIK